MTKIYRFAIAALFLGTALSFSSCSKDDPEPEVEMEEPDAAVLTFTKLDASGKETADKVTVNFELGDHDHAHTASATTSEENDHGHSHAHIHLDAKASYRLTVNMYRDEKVINDEFMQAAHLHQFFYTPKNEAGAIESGFINYTYEDKDKNNRNIGLKGKFDVLRAGSADVQVILSHGLDKSKVAQNVWMYPGLASIGGDTDMDQTFELHVLAD
ncbi:hypothetical protein [Arcticibacter sp. MXS-1]|uniref:hypothetical protein n=1 Tax=Arcticibacter sp. MXS-1 TaxID=3341726 RepID=UPI0035A8449B